MTKRGGRRKGAGRPSRTDGRTSRLYKIPADDWEHDGILKVDPDERRKRILEMSGQRLQQARLDLKSLRKNWKYMTEEERFSEVCHLSENL